MRIEQRPVASRADRVTLARPATLRDPSRAPIDVTIENLSETGALLRSDGSLPVGTLVSLGIAGIGLQMARIVRDEPGASACEFMIPLDPARVAMARSGETLVSVAFPQMPASEAARRAAIAALPVVAPPEPEAIETRLPMLPVMLAVAAVVIVWLLFR